MPIFPTSPVGGYLLSQNKWQFLIIIIIPESLEGWKYHTKLFWYKTILKYNFLPFFQLICFWVSEFIAFMLLHLHLIFRLCIIIYCCIFSTYIIFSNCIKLKWMYVLCHYFNVGDCSYIFIIIKKWCDMFIFKALSSGRWVW